MTRYPYDVPGWGVGEVWVRDRIVIQHELASEELRSLSNGSDEGFATSRARVLSTSAHDSRGTQAALARRPPAPPDGGAGLPGRTVPEHSEQDCAEIVTDLCRRIEAHLTGERTSYDGVVVDLDWATPFQRELASAARAIPWG